MRGLRILLKKSWRSIANLRIIAREQSLFKVGFSFLFASVLLLGLWALFLEGFMFLSTLGGVGLVLIPKLFSLFFFGLAVMLVISTIVTAYASFFRSDDLPFLLLKPLTLREIVFYKYLEATLYSSWAFLFIIVPFVGAYAWHEKLSPIFSVWTILFSVPFIFLCSAVGSLVTIVAIRFLPRGRWLFVMLGAILAAAGYWAFLEYGMNLRPGREATLILTSLVPGLQLASHPLWPSRWVAEGIMAMSRGQWQYGFLLMAVLWANLLMLLLVVEWCGRKFFYESWQRVLHAYSRSIRRDVLLPRTERFLGTFLPKDVRAIVTKDIRIFFRDPAQWSQGLLFFGLLGIYFLNLRNLQYHTLPVQWRNLIAFLNVFSVSAVLSSLGCRFVYPQLSLEGHSFWILGMSPASMGRILMAKFGLALTGMLTVSFGLMMICNRMLDVQAYAQSVSLALAGCVSFAVAGLSTGLGATYIDLKQRNPSAIVSGFGGTLDLVMSLTFIMLTMFPFAVIFHVNNMGHLASATFHKYLLFGFGWLALMTCVTTIVPLAVGRRSLMRREY